MDDWGKGLCMGLSRHVLVLHRTCCSPSVLYRAFFGNPCIFCLVQNMVFVFSELREVAAEARVRGQHKDRARVAVAVNLSMCGMVYSSTCDGLSPNLCVCEYND